MRSSSSSSSSKGIVALAAALLTAGAAQAQIVVAPTSYDMPNGESGSYTYHDETYNGTGDNTTSLSPLAGGLGDLTDGVLAADNWFITEPTPNGPYVGWFTVDPTITFHFAAPQQFQTVRAHFDDSGGTGGVYSPQSVIINGTTFSVAAVDPAGTEPFLASFDVSSLNLNTDTLDIQVIRQFPGAYFMVSEFQFEAVSEVVVAPEPGTLALLGNVGMLGLISGVVRRRRRRRA